MHADFYDLPDDTRHNTSANSLKKIKLPEEVTTAIIAGHLTYFELGVDGYPLHQPESLPRV
jgi:hypothetical protein